MQRVKGLSVLIPFILSGIMLLTSCGQEEASGGVTDVTEALFLSEEETAEHSKEETASSAAVATTTGVSAISDSQEQGSTSAARNLSEAECAVLQKYINEVGNYGFLLSVYEKPQDLDAEQVFFVGAGLELTIPTEEEREAYREETGTEDTVNLFAMRAEQVADYLQYKAGVSIEELTRQPGWVYLEEYDSYYQCHADEETNLCEFEVTDAAVQGDYYRVHYRALRYEKDPDGWHIPVYEAILKKNGDSYRFCANRLWMEKGLLLQPYCEVETQCLGKVKFCAYKPDNNAAEKADVTFCLVRDGDVLCTLPGMDSRNIRADRFFKDVIAVDLADYDGDGCEEIAAICSYETAEGWQGRADGLEARLYRLDENGIPTLDEELTAGINKTVSVLSLSGIAHYIKTGSDREIFADRMEAFAAEVAEADPDSYSEFALIYVNDDKAPELLEWGATADKGAKIVFYNNGILQETKISSAFSYLHKENLLLTRSGTGNLFSDQLYVYTGSRFEVYQSGFFGTMDSAVTAYSRDGKPQYTYYWEGSGVSEAGYNDALVFIYSKKDATDPTKIEMMKAEDFLQSLKK